MKYILIDELNNDVFTEEFKDEKSAVKFAGDMWESFTDSDQRRRTTFYVLESVNPDEDAPDHFDGDAIVSFKG